MTNIPSYKLRGIDVLPGLVLSPMSGVTTSAFRRLVKQLNPGCVGVVISEFISVEAMTRQVRRSLEMMRFHAEERPYVIQIFGHDIARMRDAAMMVQDAGADGIDINCGCPAPKVVKRGGGCELMRQPEHLREIISAVRKAVTIPLSAKMRSGWDSESLNALDISVMMQEEGVEALAIHGRTRAQLYRGSADWSVVQMIAERLTIPVLGSGDVVDRATALERLQGGVAGLYIGRGALTNPYIFSDIVNQNSSADSWATRLRQEPLLVLNVLDRYAALLQEEFSPKACVGKLKQLASQMCRNHAWRKQLLKPITFPELQAKLQDIRESVESGPLGTSSNRAASDDSADLGSRNEAESRRDADSAEYNENALC